MYVAGVDVGSTQTKAVIMDAEKKIAGRGLTHTGANVIGAAQRAYAQAREQAGLTEEQVGYTIGTGYGRYKVPFGDTQVTEISCHAKGACYLFPNTRTVLDIGGQDTKSIRTNELGEVVDFVMNDKCAAGTGRFLAAAAEVMGLTLDEIGETSLRSTTVLRITNVCTVFVETEIMAQLARGKSIEDILRAVHHSISGRSVSLMRRVGLEPEITMTGGVSLNVGMVAALENRLQMKINVNEDSHYVGALGASLFAWEREFSQAAAS
jgi:predicted CoA-substrate-specific enzyme activase